MSIIAITGDHPRHRYLINSLHEAGLLVGWVKQKRAPFIPTSPEGLDSQLRSLFNLHFEKRATAEDRFFGQNQFSTVKHVHTVTKETLNEKPTIEFIKKRAPRIVLSYGCHKISDELMAAVPAKFWNTHGGLSPWYRGVTTHFWPSYFLEPQMTGMTLHETTDKIDGGGIIHQTSAPLVMGDGLHDLAARTVKQYADELPLLFERTLRLDTLPDGKKQKTTGRIWIGRDWRPEHLPLIYTMYEDRIVDHVLKGKLQGRQASCMSVF